MRVRRGKEGPVSSKKVVLTMDIPEELFDVVMVPVQHIAQMVASTGQVPTTVTVDGEEVE